MMLTYHISHEKFFSTALYVPRRSGVKKIYINSNNIDNYVIAIGIGVLRGGGAKGALAPSLKLVKV